MDIGYKHYQNKRFRPPYSNFRTGQGYIHHQNIKNFDKVSLSTQEFQVCLYNEFHFQKLTKLL